MTGLHRYLASLLMMLTEDYPAIEAIARKFWILEDWLWWALDGFPDP